MIGIASDMHFKESFGYADYFDDRRKGERQQVLDTIVENFKDCDTIILNGDSLDKRHNPSNVIKDFVAFLERFEDKQVYILGGNHEKFGNGKSALDFLAELKGKDNWHLIIDKIVHTSIGGKVVTFCPYFYKMELGVDTDEEGTNALMEQLKGGDLLFVHHAISDTMTVPGMSTNLFKEIILPKAELEKRYGLVVGGHIHSHGVYNKKTIIVGSSFSNELHDRAKHVVKIDEATMEIFPLLLPCRDILKAENPVTDNALDKWELLSTVNPTAIVKVILTEEVDKERLEKIKAVFRKFETFILLEKYSKRRTKAQKVNEELLEFSPAKMLEVYSKEREVDLKKLQRGWELINAPNA